MIFKFSTATTSTMIDYPSQQNIINFLLRAIVITSLFFSLTACVPFVRFKYHHIVSKEAALGAGYGAGLGAIIGGLAEVSIPAGAGIGAGALGLIGADLASEHHWLYKLQRERIQVVQIGNYVKIIIPSDKIFYFNSATIIPQHYHLLKDVTEFIEHYGRPNQIVVAGYTDNVQSPAFNLKLSRHQAQSVTAFLWSHGIPFRILKPVGMGNSGDIASNDDPLGSAYNRRIEIRFNGMT